METADINHVALDPTRSVVVEACAGSGKTWLLVSRIVRLLLSGTPPSSILAITFTHKAAGEMRARLYDWLHHCATASDADVRQFLLLRDIPANEIDTLVPVARTLLETTLTAQPGIRLITFHAWFYELIKRAPLTSALAGYTLTEQTGPLLAQAWSQWRSYINQHPTSTLARDLQQLLADIGLANTRQLLEQFVYQRSHWWAWTEHQADPIGWAEQQLITLSNIHPDADVAAELLKQPDFARQLQHYITLMAGSTETRQRVATELATINIRSETSLERFSRLILNKDGSIKNSFSPGKTDATLALYDAHQRISITLCDARQQIIDQQACQFSLHGIRLGHALLSQYQQLKQQARVLDFTDIEWQAARMLTDSHMAGYLLLKLDARYQHLLLDEFQDTNPVQWRILQAWLHASGVNDSTPTVFLVGDPKQSIYRFRGAQSGLFQRATDALCLQGAARLQQNRTRRSAWPIIDAVNRCFSQLDHALFQPHEVLDRDQPGRIEVLPIATRTDASAFTPLVCRNPLDTAAPEDQASHARMTEAQQLADTLRQIVGTWVINDPDSGTPRFARYRDIMILVRQRKHLATYEWALKQAGIPYLSTRRGGLLDSQEIGDIMALLQALTNPNNDLALARALRSPIFACSNQDLQQITLHQRSQPRSNWWRCLQTLPDPHPLLDQTRQQLRHWRDLASRVPVHDLLDRIMHEANLEQRYMAAAPPALAASTLANLSAFMQLSLTLSAGRYPSLTRFLLELQQLRSARNEQPDEGNANIGADAVHIRTVHGAKGLEAPIVWLLDSGGRAAPARHYEVLTYWSTDAAQPSHFSLLGRKSEQARWQAHALQQDQLHSHAEQLNLLYVAMTRARQALIVSASDGRSQHDNWHRIIAEALGGDAFNGAYAGVDLACLPSPTQRADDTPILPAESATPIISIGRRLALACTPSPAAELGELVHRLLELSAPPRPMREHMPRQFSHHPLWDAAWTICQRILDQPDLQKFFDPQHYVRAYNELSYLRADGRNGRIDRMVEFDQDIWLLDYKTGHTDDPIATHQAQLHTYRDALQHCHPNTPIRCALITLDAVLIVV